MKKIIFIGTVIILFGLAGYIFITQKSANREVLQLTSQGQTEALSQPSSAKLVDAKDNLDQALQDLDQIE